MSSHLFSKVSCFIKVLWVMMEDEDVAENWEEAGGSRQQGGENSAERTSGQHGCTGRHGSPLCIKITTEI